MPYDAVGYLLDTNVLSELMRERPEPQVMLWIDSQRETSLFTSTITQAEIFSGVAFLPTGKRREALEAGAIQLFLYDFEERCLAFDAQAALRYAHIRTQRRNAGKPISTEDAQIAAIALAKQFTLVTRNSKDFMEIENLVVINPWHSVP